MRRAQCEAELEVEVEVEQTLRSDQNQRQVGRVPVAGQAAVVVVDGLEADLVLQAEDEDDGVHPQSELEAEQRRFRLSRLNHS